ncbi:hypothetical protein HDU86_008492 [Geranomyces michiganensis]|nr:hypothetical protein HDU86_008492 [Geranomyces michiganensis]
MLVVVADDVVLVDVVEELELVDDEDEVELDDDEKDVEALELVVEDDVVVEDGVVLVEVEVELVVLELDDELDVVEGAKRMLTASGSHSPKGNKRSKQAATFGAMRSALCGGYPFFAFGVIVTSKSNVSI